MTADLADAVAGLRAWLPEAQARTHLPDTEATAGPRSRPGSRPPWNSQAANALYDALEGVRQLEAMWRSDLAGHGVPLRPAAVTGATLASVLRLAGAVSEADRRHAVVAVTRWTVAILQLPAVDEAERPLRVAAECPYCGFPMLRVFPRSGRVACLRGAGGCADVDGNPPVGLMGRSELDGTPCIAWADGLVT